MKKKNNTAISRFSKSSETYICHSHLQRDIAYKLTDFIAQYSHRGFFELGAGTGWLFEAIAKRALPYECYIATDASSKMLLGHPAGRRLRKEVWNFDTPIPSDLPSGLTAVSSSALHWSCDLSLLSSRLAKRFENGYFSIFTSRTFSSLHRSLGLSSPLKRHEEVVDIFSRHFLLECNLERYTMQFTTAIELLRYIKMTGVGFIDKEVDLARLLAFARKKECPLELEFEVLYMRARR